MKRNRPNPGTSISSGRPQRTQRRRGRFEEGKGTRRESPAPARSANFRTHATPEGVCYFVGAAAAAAPGEADDPPLDPDEPEDPDVPDGFEDESPDEPDDEPPPSGLESFFCEL